MAFANCSDFKEYISGQLVLKMKVDPSLCLLGNSLEFYRHQVNKMSQLPPGNCTLIFLGRCHVMFMAQMEAATSAPVVSRKCQEKFVHFISATKAAIQCSLDTNQRVPPICFEATTASVTPPPSSTLDIY